MMDANENASPRSQVREPKKFDPKGHPDVAVEYKAMRARVEAANDTIRECEPRMRVIEQLIRAYGGDPETIAR